MALGMSFAQKVEALRSLMGVPSDAPLPAAVEMMNIAMGIVGEGALPKQVDSLVCATGVSLASDPRLVPQATVVTHVAVDARRRADGQPRLAVPAGVPHERGVPDR